MLNIGCHLSSSQGFLHMGEEALELEANTFQFFSRNPRGSQAKAVDPQDAAALVQLTRKHHFTSLLVHAPYTMNACSADPGLRTLAERMITEDLAVLETHLPGNLYNFHPGSHVGQGVDVGIEQIAGMLNRVLTAEQTTFVLLETMSGKGSEIGSTFGELQEIICRVQHNEKLGVCLDTCHLYSAGYDLVNNLDAVLCEFERVIGLKRLKAIHLNDSMTPFDSHKDRHECIGKGTLGLAAIVRLIHHPALKHLPFLLETPNELPGYAAEIRLLRGSAV